MSSREETLNSPSLQRWVDDVSLASSVALYEASVSFVGLPQELSTKLLVDDAHVTTIAGDQTTSRTFNVGETDRLSAATCVYRDDGTKYYCAPNSVTISSHTSITFSYGPQYCLSVKSPYRKVAGTGWYDAGATVTFSVDRSAPGPSGADHLVVYWRITFVFDDWTGDSSSTSPSNSIKMHRPKKVIAAWRSEKSSHYRALLVVTGGIVAGIVVTYLIISTKSRPIKASLVNDGNDSGLLACIDDQLNQEQLIHAKAK